MNPVEARLNEINFLELCTRIEAINHKPIQIKQLIAALSSLFEFNVLKMNEIVDKIFTPRFSLNINELATLVNNGYITMTELQNLFKKSKRTIQRYKAKGKNATLYPRLDEEEQLVLHEFMTQYNRYFTKDYANILNVNGKDDENDEI